MDCFVNPSRVVQFILEEERQETEIQEVRKKERAKEYEILKDKTKLRNSPVVAYRKHLDRTSGYEFLEEQGRLITSLNELPSNVLYSTANGLEFRKWGDTVLVVTGFAPISIFLPLEYDFDNLKVMKQKREDEYYALSTAAELISSPLTLYREDIYLLNNLDQISIGLLEAREKGRVTFLDIIGKTILPFSFNFLRNQEEIPIIPCRGVIYERFLSLLLAKKKLVLPWKSSETTSAGTLIYFIHHIPISVIFFTKNGLRLQRINETTVCVEGFSPIPIPKITNSDLSDVRMKNDHLNLVLTQNIIATMKQPNPFQFNMEEITARPIARQHSLERNIKLGEYDISDVMDRQEEGLCPNNKRSSIPTRSLIQHPSYKETVQKLRRIQSERLSLILNIQDIMPEEEGGNLKTIDLEKDDSIYGCTYSRSNYHAWNEPCTCNKCLDVHRRLYNKYMKGIVPDGETVMSPEELGIRTYDNEEDLLSDTEDQEPETNDDDDNNSEKEEKVQKNEEERIIHVQEPLTFFSSFLGSKEQEHKWKRHSHPKPSSPVPAAAAASANDTCQIPVTLFEFPSLEKEETISTSSPSPRSAVHKDKSNSKRHKLSVVLKQKCVIS